MWSSDYIRNLPPAFQKFKKAGNLQVGSVVLIRDDLPGMNWSLGVLERLFEGRDGLVRVAVVKTPHGSKTRAVQKLHCLEISRSSDHE